MATQSSSQSPWTALLWEDRLNNSCVSHNEPVLCCQYKKSFWQVVSCSEGSAIKVWDLQNGQLVTEVYEVHGHAAVTCMALDTSGKRIFIVKHLKGHAHKWIGLTVWTGLQSVTWLSVMMTASCVQLTTWVTSMFGTSQNTPFKDLRRKHQRVSNTFSSPFNHNAPLLCHMLPIAA
ncbi:uncharacterized protein LOC122465529 isoform X2 [Chelonia mydas]|uniref:uncharacterized protein LOC122465529 isoform X2 n=1 Tax=Chelonia mydas TaxID=8469 RepID=UPI001CA8A281|nr:uncharacterized protein LOC122465529 isoform X2 [Chelonia mydas]